MKTRYVLIICGLLGLFSCVKDDSTDGTGAISEILIEEGSIKELYDIDKNQVLTISPKCKQTNADKALGFTWEIDQKVYSHGPEFVYTGDRLGSYDCRLIVENEDGKTFFPFKLNVNSPYEEGITVLSRDAQGRSMLSFMLKQRVEGVEDHFENGDCFVRNNPDMVFASNVSDMVQCDGNLIISCRGGNGTPASIYYLNEKTFVVQNYIDASDYPDFKPVRLAIPANGYAGISYPILCEDGAAYEISVSDGVVIPSSKLNLKYAPVCEVTSKSSVAYNLFFWDDTNKGLCQIMNGYGPYYCSETYLLDISNLTESNNYFNGREFVAMFMPRVPQSSLATEMPTVVVVTKNKVMYQKVVLNANFWNQNTETGTLKLADNGGQKMCSFAEPKLKAQSPLVASRLYYTLFFGEEHKGDKGSNKVYAWNYTTSQLLADAKEYCAPGSEKAVVTGMELSQDQQELFVAFYEPDESGLNGHVWVYDTQEGRLLRKYDNVCYRPVKIMYKKK